MRKITVLNHTQVIELNLDWIDDNGFMTGALGFLDSYPSDVEALIGFYAVEPEALPPQFGVIASNRADIPTFRISRQWIRQHFFLSLPTFNGFTGSNLTKATAYISTSKIIVERGWNYAPAPDPSHSLLDVLQSWELFCKGGRREWLATRRVAPRDSRVPYTPAYAMQTFTAIMHSGMEAIHSATDRLTWEAHVTQISLQYTGRLAAKLKALDPTMARSNVLRIFTTPKMDEAFQIWMEKRHSGAFKIQSGETKLDGLKSMLTDDLTVFESETSQTLRIPDVSEEETA